MQFMIVLPKSGPIQDREGFGLCPNQFLSVNRKGVKLISIRVVLEKGEIHGIIYRRKLTPLAVLSRHKQQSYSTCV